MSIRYLPVSRRKKIAAALFALAGLYFSIEGKIDRVWATQLETINGFPVFIIRQEQYERDQVLVSRPDPLDERIQTIFRLNSIYSLEDYSHWLQNNISYQKDFQENWESAQETLNKKHGDCKSYAFLNAAILKVMGYQPRILALTRREGGHAVCVFQKDGYYLWFDNSRLKKTRAQDLKELEKEIAKEHSFSSVYEYQTQNKSWQLMEI